jgi:4-hydroxy-tetrahydrodipicolinate synthase
MPMIRLLFSEPNPAPLKAALSMQGLMRDELRLPMTPATSACRSQLAAALEVLDDLPVHAPAAVRAARVHTAEAI